MKNIERISGYIGLVAQLMEVVALVIVVKILLIMSNNFGVILGAAEGFGL